MTTSIDDMERRLPGVERDLAMYTSRVAELRELAAAAEARIAGQRAELERARAEKERLKARAEELEARVAQLESGPEPIQCSMGRPTRANGATAKLAHRRPLFAAALARRDALMREHGLSRAAAWDKAMREDATLKERLIAEASRAGGER